MPRTAKGTRYKSTWTRNGQGRRVYTYEIWYGRGEDESIVVVMKPEQWLRLSEINAIAEYWKWFKTKARKVTRKREKDGT